MTENKYRWLYPYPTQKRFNIGLESHYNSKYDEDKI